jgi:hypothetical protein
MPSTISSAPASRSGGSVPSTAMQRIPAALAERTPASVSSNAVTSPGAIAGPPADRSSSARRYPYGCGLPLSTWSEATTAVNTSASPAAAITGSISSRAAPDTMPTGTRDAA